MNIEASIVPGESAAGIQLGSRIEEILKEQETHFLSEEIVHPLLPSPTTLRRYRSAMVDLWVREGIVDQIMVHDGYRGKLMDKIGLGSTIADIEMQIDAWEEDEEDNLVIRDLPGVGFEIEGYFPDLKDPAFRHAPIKDIYVFQANKELSSLTEFERTSATT
ncbi:MAG TPA: hypothetical protein VK140_03260 [Ktedonobacteraceae bacterium]|nr:hypothetical protein [Ktedonobacteraceae bacterium]